jgi:hypothetical protein
MAMGLCGSQRGLRLRYLPSQIGTVGALTLTVTITLSLSLNLTLLPNL